MSKAEKLEAFVQFMYSRATGFHVDGVEFNMYETDLETIFDWFEENKVK